MNSLNALLSLTKLCVTAPIVLFLGNGMDLITIFIIGFVCGIVFFVVTHLRPLDDQEVTRLGEKRRRYNIRNYFTFYKGEFKVSNDFKKSMDPNGTFYQLNEELVNFPSVAAALLKYKKHEWIIVAFEKSRFICSIWLNKGFDKSSVSLYLPIQKVANLAKKEEYGSVLIFHNHPNSNPSKYDCTKPSEQDILSAMDFAEVLNNQGLNLLEFVCERGISYEYYLSPADTFYPIDRFIEDIKRGNGVSLLKNLGLHIERIFLL